HDGGVRVTEECSKTAGGDHEKPETAHSMAYSGQCLAKICLQTGAVLAETSMTVVWALRLPNDASDRRRLAPGWRRHSDLNPGPDWTPHKPCTCWIQIQRFRISHGDLDRSEYPKLSELQPRRFA